MPTKISSRVLLLILMLALTACGTSATSGAVPTQAPTEVPEVSVTLLTTQYQLLSGSVAEVNVPKTGADISITTANLGGYSRIRIPLLTPGVPDNLVDLCLHGTVEGNVLTVSRITEGACQ